MTDARERAAGTGRIWVVSELYFPELTSTGFFLTHIAEGLASHYEVHALCGQPTHAARGMRAPARELRNAVQVVRAVPPPPVLPFLPRTACGLRRARCVLLVHAVYPENLLAAGLMARNGVA